MRSRLSAVMVSEGTLLHRAVVQGDKVPCVAYSEVEEECPEGELCAVASLERHKAIDSHRFRRSCVVLPFQVWSIIETLLIPNHQIFL